MRSQTGRGAFAWAMLAPTLAFAEVSPGSAPTGGLSLRWSDPESLAGTSAAEFDARLSERLGHPAFNPTDTHDSLAVSWQGSAEQCRVELELVHETKIQGTRILASPSGDCRSLLPALLTVAALLIESRPEEPEPVAPPPPPPPSPPRPAPAPEAATREPQREAWVLLSLGASVGSGLTPKLELGPAAALVFAPFSHFRAGVMGTLFFPHQYGAAPGFSLEHDSVAVLACGTPLTGTVNLGLCGDAAWHRFSSHGISLPHPESKDASELTVGVMLRVEWRLMRQLWWVGHVGTDFTPQPLYFYFTPAAGGESVLFRQQRVAPSVFLGLSLELP